ncbi:STAS domain-containing protein [Rhodococcus sp. HNM0563]|uniref:anti-sigma factor antagonist n=1 Tax=Rhodococcus sp. HNM0563 TaxID=2716339 RepID=UPI00146BFE49|nr:STAS domain-containing protein [Rhodococcus sp. HNM0563]
MNERSSEHPHMGLKTTRSDSVAVLSVSGDVDLSSAPLLEEEALGLLDEDLSGLIVDLTDVHFLASMGMALLVDLSKRAADSVAFAVVAEGNATARPLELLGLGDVLSIHPRLEDALAAVKPAEMPEK